MKETMDDTIVAISTAPGAAAIGIIRLSGGEAFPICDRIFDGVDRKKVISDLKSHTIHHGTIFDRDGRAIDEVLISVMKGPRSYTGEDVVEISCHGNALIMTKILNLCIESGARVAQPGEFTRRAFLNGKMDLTQAEAVADLIYAKSEEPIFMALEDVMGGLKRKMAEIKELIVDLLAELEAGIDFPEEDISTSPGERTIQAISEIAGRCEKMMASYENGRFIKEGMKIAIVGKPNVGKSSIFNRLIGINRAITDGEPGTTRDYLEETVVIEGVQFVIYDTAGISGAIKEGALAESMRRSKVIIDKSDYILFVCDRSSEWSPEDHDVVQSVQDKKGLIIYNKSDLERVIGDSECQERLNGWQPIEASAMTGEGIDFIKESIYETYCVGAKTTEPEGIAIYNARQLEALSRCGEALGDAIKACKECYPEEIIAIEMKRALNHIGEITGETASEQILDKIFSRFCIGK